MAGRLLHALSRGIVTFKVGWCVEIKPLHVSAGVVRPGENDFVMTSEAPHAGYPRVLSVAEIANLGGRLDYLAPDWPRESRDSSSWIVGVRFSFKDGDEILVDEPWRGGWANMRFPHVEETKETHAVHVVEVQEPVIVDHAWVCLPFHCSVGKVAPVTERRPVAGMQRQQQSVI